MILVASIVEGDAEVMALPVLLRRLKETLSPDADIDILKPIRVRRDRFLNRDDEFKRFLLMAADKCGENGCVLIVLDADDDCPAESGAHIRQRAKSVIPHRFTSVILAHKEYEAWFIASAPSLHGKRGFVFNNPQPVSAETIRDAKGWMSHHMPEGRYSEILDQPAFSAHMDIQLARNNSRSFQKLCQEWQEIHKMCTPHE